MYNESTYLNLVWEMFEVKHNIMVIVLIGNCSVIVNGNGEILD